ncbi:MAG: heme-binding domain-containing protein [Chitinophagaceae bacterium]|nr:heme-binding domain-containing protein [Chitinophagaceae bacterium]
MIRKILVFLLVVLLIIQFFRPAKNVSISAQPNALAKVYPVPENVDTIMTHACYDCHTNNSRYPWYFNVQPSAWFLANHIRDGKRHLNFDEFMTYPKDKQDDKLKDLIDMVDADDMPLSSYTWMHADARLNKEQKAAITAWAKDLRKKINK